MNPSPASRLFARPSAGALLAAMLVVLVPLARAADTPWGGGQTRWRNILDTPPDFYGSPESHRVAENVLLYQHDNGGWPKNIDMARQLSDEQRQRIEQRRNEFDTLIDNGATFTQIRFLARMHQATGQPRYAEAARRGIEYLLDAQYDNGGWPMFYPIRHGYYQRITFNDGAMIGVMRLLRDVAGGEGSFEFADSELRERARHAIDRGLEAILRCQVEVDGQPTAWCAQHDEVDFSPAAARSYELPSLSGYESVGIVEYLMNLDDPSPQVQRAIEGAVAWFDQVRIEGLDVQWKRDPETHKRLDRVVVEDASAGPLWARFYEIGNNRPMFVGRDGIVQDHLADIERERRLGYAWLGDWAEQLLEEDYPRWQEKWNQP